MSSLTDVSGVAAMAAVWVWPGRPTEAGRLGRVIGPAGGRTIDRPSPRSARSDGVDGNPDAVDDGPRRGRWVGAAPTARLLRPAVRRGAALACLAAGALTIGGVLGLVLGAVAGSAAMLIRPTAASGEQIRVDDVPVVLDLVAGCLAAGVGWPDSLDAAAKASGGEVGFACAQVASALRCGAPPEEAYAGWLTVAALSPAARSALRTARSGAAAADELHRTAARLRAHRRSEAQHRVRRASVWLVVPLGLCFLPAFVLLAVVPIVIGLVPALH